MAGFFPIHPGIGGGGGQNPDTAFTGVTIAGNTITFHRQNGQTHPVDLGQIIPDATNESIKEIRVDGKNLVLTKVDNSELTVNLTQLLAASNISFNGANAGLASTDVQGAIEEVNDKFNGYVPLTDVTNVGGVQGADKVAKLDNNGLLDVTMLPEIAINRYYPVANLGVAEAQRGDYQNGDIIYAQDTQKTYLVINNDGVNNFQQDAIIELTPQVGINLPIDATDVNYNKNQTNLNAGNVQEAIDEVYDKFKDGYNASNYNQQTGQLTLTKHDGQTDTHNIVNPNTIIDAQLNQNTNTIQFTQVDNGTKDVDLTPLLIANKIAFTPGATGMVAQDVQAAIEELKADMAFLDDSDVYIVQNETELNNLLIQTQLKTGDIIYIINSDGVLDYTGTPVNNGTNPVAMIYDDNAVGNKLRIFSKLDTTINIDAHNVKYDDQTTQLGATDVQEAIENLNNKFDNYVPVADVTTTGGNTGANMVVRLDGQGLLAENMLPKVATNEYYEVANLVDAEAQRTNYQNGDVIYDQNTQKKYLIINNEPNNNFQQDAIIELNPQVQGTVGVTDVVYTEGNQRLTVTKDGGIVQNYDLSKLNTTINSHAPVDGNINLNLNKAGDNIELTVQGQQVAMVTLDEYVKTVNNRPNQGGNVTVDAEHINYSNVTSQLVSANVQGAIDELNEKIKKSVISINNELPNTQGNIDLSLEMVGDELQFKVKDNVKSTLELYTDADANTLIQYFV